MKLRSCHIENFGKISDLYIDFTDGINVIREPNAWGKSTLAAFIKVMFYGFDSRKEPGAFEKERNRYRPWQGGIYGGELDFSIGNRTYRISRTFGRTEKRDEFHIYDLSTNLESVDFTSNLGEEIFDLDSNSFKRSIYIAQKDCESRTSDGINAKLGNLAANTNDINNYESAQDRLKNLANQMTPNRVTGSISKRRNRLTELGQELKSFEAADAAMMELKGKLKESEAKKEALSQKRDAYAKELRIASEESRRTEQRKNYQGICSEYEEKQKIVMAFRQLFPYGVPSDEVLGEQVKAARRMEEEETLLHHLELTEGEQEKSHRLADMFEDILPTDAEIDERIEEWSGLSQLREEHSRCLHQLELAERESRNAKEAPEEPSSRSNGAVVGGILLEFAGVLAIVLGIVFRTSIPYAEFIMIAGGAVLVLATAVLFAGISRRKKEESARYRKHLEWEKEQKSREYGMKELRQQEKEKDAEIQRMKAKTKEYLGKYRISCEEKEYASSLYELKNLLHEYQRLKERRQKYQESEKQWRRHRADMDAFGKKLGVVFGEDVTADVAFLQKEAAEYRMASLAAEAVRKKKESFEAGTDMKALFAEPQNVGSLEEINQQIHFLDHGIEEVRSAIEQYTRQLEDLQEQLDLKDEKEQELAACQKQQDEENRMYTTVTLTQEYLQRAKEQLTARYMAPISDAFRKYYRILSGSADEDWTIDANIAIRRREQGELREAKWLSAGYQDLIGICMRLALVDAMYQEEKPFLILDDPFINLDEEKSRHGMALLTQVAKEYQTIYFTCHKSRDPGIE